MNEYNIKNYPVLYASYRKETRKTRILLIVFAAVALVFLAAGLLVNNPSKGLWFTFSVMFLFIGLIFLITFAINKNSSSKSLVKLPPEALKRVNDSLLTSPSFEGLTVTADAVVYTFNSLILFPLEDILWIYRHELSTYYAGFIPLGKTAYAVICTRNGKRQSIRLKNNKIDVVGFLQSQLSRIRRGIFYGYDADLDKMFRKNIGQMIAMSDQYASQTPQNM